MSKTNQTPPFVGLASAKLPESSRQVAPETSYVTVDYQAFEEEDLYLGLFPHYVLGQLGDGSNMESKIAAVDGIRKAIKDCEDSSLLQQNLREVVGLVTRPLSDPNFRVVLAGLDLLNDLVSKVGILLGPYLKELVSSYLGKVGSNRYVVKQTGMAVLNHLMEVLKPWPVVVVVASYGLSHKQSRVREETLNIITASLLKFPNGEFDLLSLVQQTAPLLADSKQKVRQACLEEFAVLADRLGKKDLLQQVVSAVVSVERGLINNLSANPNLSLMLAFQARIARQMLPQLNQDGLVDHVINVTSCKGGPCELAGSDVDWIMAAAGKSSLSPKDSQKVSGSGYTIQTAPGPIRSAGKRLPWDVEPRDQELAAKANNGFAQQHQQFSSKAPSLACPRKAVGYLDMYQKRMMSKEQSTMGYNNTDFGGYSKMAEKGTMYVPPMQGSLGSGQPLPSTSRGWGQQYHALGSSSKGGPDLLSTTWPRANGYSSMKASRQISADSKTLAATIAMGTPRKSNSGPSDRPTSRPLVHNPFSFSVQHHSLQKQGSSSTVPPTVVPQTHTHIQTHTPSTHPSHAHNPDSPSWTEQGFLLEDDLEYFSIPADDSILDRSLSSSLSSLCPSRDHQLSKKSGSQTVDVLSHIREKAALKREEILSAHVQTTSELHPPIKGASPKTTQAIKGITGPASAPLPFGKKHGSKARPEPLTLGDSPPELSKISPRVDTGGDFSRTFPFAEPTPLQEPTLSPTRQQAPEKTFNIPRKRGGNKVRSSVDPGGMESYPDTGEILLRHIVPGKKKEKSPSKSTSASYPVKASQLASPNTSTSAPICRPGWSTNLSFSEDTEESSHHLVELLPLEHPELALKEAMQGLNTSSEEWESKCSALITLRRLGAHHPAMLVPCLNQVVLAVEKEVKNLRSQVARGAIACLGDLFCFLKRDIEQLLDKPVRTLLHVGVKSNQFLREDVEKALYEMIVNVNTSRCLLALTSSGGLSHASTTVRRITIQQICSAVEISGPKFSRLPRDAVERTLTAVAQTLADADAGARYYARKTLHHLCTLPEFESLITRYASEQQALRLREAVENLKTKGLGKSPGDLQSARVAAASRLSGSLQPVLLQSGSGSSPPSGTQLNPKKLRKIRPLAPMLHDAAIASPEVPLPSDLLARMKANDWRDRLDALDELETFVLANFNSLGASLVKMFDVINARLNDKNSKVNLRALQVFQQIVPVLCAQLQPVLPTTVEALASTVASRFPPVHSAALTAIDTLLESVDHALLIQPVASAAQNGNARVQPIMLRKLAELIPSVKPAIVSRVALPVMWQLLCSRAPSTAEAKTALLTLCHALHTSIGPALLESSAAHLTPQQQQRLQELVSSSIT